MQKNHSRRVCSTIFLILTVVLITACGKIPIAETSSESEANLMFDVLYSHQLVVEKKAKSGEKGGWEIIIDEGWFGEEDAAVGTQILNDYGLPRPKNVLPATTNAYGMETPEETRKRQNREKEIQIEDHLYSGLPGVIRVSVILAQPENDPLSLQKLPPTATVSIVQKEAEPKFSIETVKTMVSGSLPNLTAENIRVAVSTQTLREIPLERLKAKRRSNMLFALGGGLIALLAAALGVIWFVVKRRKNPPVKEAEQLSEGDANELETNEQYALNAADEDEY